MNEDRDTPSQTAEDIARQFGVPREDVHRWIHSGEVVNLKDVPVEEIEAWLASREWGESSDSQTRAPAHAMTKEEAELRKLREEALKLRAESFRLIREASQLRIRWYNRPAF